MIRKLIPVVARSAASLKKAKPVSTPSPDESQKQDEFRQRLDAVLEMNGLPKRGRVTKLHEVLSGVSWSTARKMLMGEGYPSAETLVEMQRHLGISIDWLLGGQGSPLLGGKQQSTENHWDAVVFMKLPEGGKEEVVVVPGMRQSQGMWVQKVEGDAMAPDLMDGDYALVSGKVSAIESKVIYLLRGPAGTFFRRLEQSVTGAGLRLVPRNSILAPEHVPGVAFPGEPMERSLVQVLGKVEKKLIAKV